jgi:hypothetical protein
MASGLISLGLGPPASIPTLILLGLAPTGPTSRPYGGGAQLLVRHERVRTAAVTREGLRVPRMTNQRIQRATLVQTP